MDRQPDGAADDRAVDADELQIAANGGFQLFGDGAGIPFAHRVADKADNGIAIIIDEADGSTAKMQVDGAAQRSIGGNTSAKGAHGGSQLAGRQRFGAVEACYHRAAGAVPQPRQPLAHGGIGDQIILEGFNLDLAFGEVSQIKRPDPQTFGDLGAQWMLWIMAHVTEKATHPVDERIGYPLVDADQPQQPGGVFRYHVADGRRLRTERRQPPIECAVEQRLVAALVERRIDGIGNHRRECQCPQSIARGITDKIADGLLVQRFDQAGDEGPETAALAV